MDEHQSVHATTESFGTFLPAPVLNIDDLPLEVLEIIFVNIDAINRKKIERVCKRWMEIIRGARRFRTHLEFELPSPLTRHAHNFWHPSNADWFASLRLFLKADLEAIHFKSRDRFNRTVTMDGIYYILHFLKTAGVDLSKVEITFSDYTIDCDVRRGNSRPAEKRKIRVIRSNITASRLFGSSTLYFEELWLENLDKLPQQIRKLFLAENGPLTKEQSDVLGRLERRCTINAVPDMLPVYRFAAYLGSMRYDAGYDWIEVLTTIANGGHVSKHTADFLARNF